MLGGDLSVITICRESVCCQHAGNLKVDLAHVNVGELSAELETIQHIRCSACHMLNALPRPCYHDLILVDYLRLEVFVCMHVCVCMYVFVCVLCVCMRVCRDHSTDHM